MPPQAQTPFAAFSGRAANKLSASARRPGKWTGNVGGGGCDAGQSKAFRTETRNTVRAAALVKAAAYIGQVAGGEKRRVRRAMALSLAKRIFVGVREPLLDPSETVRTK
jgi:hypothetical protein